MFGLVMVYAWGLGGSGSCSHGSVLTGMRVVEPLSTDLEFVDEFGRLWGIILRDGCQGLVLIDVTLTNELTGLWINLAKVASLRAM